MLPFLLATISLALGAADGVTLVENHEPGVVIVLPGEPFPIAMFAADELVYHVKKATGAVVNDSDSTMDERKAAIADLIRVRRALEGTGIANMDRAAIIETDSWEDVEGLFDP